MKLAFSLALAVCLATLTPAHAHAAPVIAWAERDQGALTPQMGWLLLGELNCTACHTDPQGQWAKRSKAAPRLEHLAARVSLDYMRRFIAHPSQVKPGTTMPDLFTASDPALVAEQVENLVHFLASLTPERPPLEAAPIGGRDRGRELYLRIGCTACHDPQPHGQPALDGSVPLGDLAAKYTLPSLASFLLDPLAVRPSGRMPAMRLSPEEARDLAAFLLPGVPEEQGIAYQYYEGQWNTLPRFDELEPVASGVTDRIDVSVRRKDEQFGLRFQGRMVIREPGEYTFSVASDDGSRLFIDGKMVVDHDGVHATAEKQGTCRLDPGAHLVEVEYFEGGGEESLRVEIEGPKLARQPLAGLLLRASRPPLPEPASLEIDPRRVAKGRELFAQLGCAACHRLDSVPHAAKTGPALADLSGRGGCLAASPVTGLPDYGLSERQRAALALGLAQLDAFPSASDSQGVIAATLAAMNCYACHSRDGVGGVTRDRDPYFSTTQPEMGDEGRIPPALDGVGGKLTDAWLRTILHEGAKDRPYMQTRMPAFGASNVGHLAPHFQALDCLPPLSPLPMDRAQAKRDGWQLVGSKGFSCIKCHTFGEHDATGVQSIDMTIMHRRLRPEWFARYVRNPQQFRPNTRMPAAWPLEGKSLLPGILDGDCDRQVRAVWMFLEDGPSAKTPLGLVSNTMELIPGYEALIYRNFIEGAGPRAIAVGYPEGIHLAFDANDLRLALVWKGAFIDAGMHWTGRGSGFQRPAGRHVQSLPAGVAFAQLEGGLADWPHESARELPGYQFQGYELVEDRRPIFHYRCGPIDVHDEPRPVVTDGGAHLVRRLTLSSDQAAEGWHFRAAVARRIERLPDGSFQMGEVQMRFRSIKGNPEPMVRQGARGQQELLVPLRVGPEPMVLEQEIIW